jgi:hypothetical protein
MNKVKYQAVLFVSGLIKSVIYFLPSIFQFFNSKPFAFFTIISVLFVHGVQSQDRPDSLIQKQNISNYILHFDTVFAVTLNTNSEIDYYTMKSEDYFIDIRPNISVSNKLSLSYRFINVGIGFTPKFYPGNNDDYLEGHTKAFSLGLNIAKKHWLQEIKYAKVKGFYLYNTGDFEDDWIKGTDPYTQLPELEVKTYRGVTGYKFNPNFSINALSSQSEKQLKSSGSIISFLRYDFYQIDNNADQRSNNFTTTLTLGYMYSLVLGSKFYISAGFFPGGGINYTKLFTTMEGQEFETNSTTGVFRLSGKSGIGYDNNKFFAGTQFSFTSELHKQENASFTNQLNRAYLQFFFGYRFNAPRFLKKETDAVKNLAPEMIKKNLE